MFSLIASLYQEWRGSEQYNLCILGINQTGKTVLFNAIKRLDQPSSSNTDKQSAIITYKPTVGLNVTKYKNGIERFVIWDLGGKQSIRKIWQNYYSQCHGVIYLINHNMQEGIQTLKGILSHQQMAKIPIAVIATGQGQKQRIEHSLSNLDCLKDRKYNVYCLPIDKMPYMSSQIKEILRCMYGNIRCLHDQLKQ